MSKNKEKGRKKALTGVIQITRKGTGYVAWPEDTDKEDIEVRVENLGGALNGDTVEVELTGVHPRPRGKVRRVVERAKEEFVATIERAGVARADDVRFYRPITLDEPGKYTEGEKVLVRLLSFDGNADPKATVLKHLGRAGQHNVEMSSIVLEHGFQTEFPEAVVAEARAAEAAHAETIKTELGKRTDFRDAPTFTIDPENAKDFDDALSITELPNGQLEVGIHIADATYFVRPGTALGEEAERRGTSVYLVDQTIPMLPHEISAGIASLKPEEERLAFSAIFRLSEKAEVLERSFKKTVIRSKKRFTYEEAQKVLNSGNGPFVKELAHLRALARILRQKREREGAIDFGDNEVKFELDENGKVLGITRKERLETMQLVEEFMLLANREVAAYISKLAEKVPEKNMIFLYRVHDEPKQDRIQELATFVRAIGYEFAGKSRRSGRDPDLASRASGKKSISVRDIAKLLKDIEGKPEEHLIRTATLRSMAKAIYSTKNIGHFGLSFNYYTHFTSPIRRYPDMLAHRILASHLDGKPITRKEYTHLEKQCIAASEAEAKAVNAERESIKYKQVEYMSEKVGQEFDAVISGVTDWGLYVEEVKSAAEGLVPIRTLGEEFFTHSKKDYALVGERTKKKHALGDKVRVKLVSADLASKQLEFGLAKQK